MRSRGGGGTGGGAGARRGTRTGVVRSVYEDFKPLSEWQQDDESHVLNIYLPGFMKEQVRITTEGRNTVRVRGERLVAGNKWSRFLEDYQVPENGEMNSVRAKFQGGILRVTVPKEGVGKPQDALPPETRDVDEIRKQPTPQKAIPQVKDGKEPQQKQPIQKPETRGVDDIRKQPTPQKGGQVKPIPEVKGGKEPQSNQKQPIPPQKGLDKPFPQAGTSQSTEEKSLEPVKASPEPNNERDLDGDHRTRNEVSQGGGAEKEESSENQRGRSFTPTGNVINQNAEKKESGDVTKEKVHKESKETMGGSESPEAETTKTKESEKSIAAGIPEKTADNKDSHGAPKQQNYKKAVKGLTELNEERQLLVNMGVAMLVIMALTAYVTHSFASAKHNN